MVDDDIERLAVEELLQEARTAEERLNPLPTRPSGCVNKRLLCPTLASTLRNPVLPKTVNKRKHVGLDDIHFDEDKPEKRPDDGREYEPDADYIYDARRYFDPEKYREIVKNRQKKEVNLKAKQEQHESSVHLYEPRISQHRSRSCSFSMQRETAHNHRNTRSFEGRWTFGYQPQYADRHITSDVDKNNRMRDNWEPGTGSAERKKKHSRHSSPQSDSIRKHSKHKHGEERSKLSHSHSKSKKGSHSKHHSKTKHRHKSSKLSDSGKKDEDIERKKKHTRKKSKKATEHCSFEQEIRMVAGHCLEGNNKHCDVQGLSCDNVNSSVKFNGNILDCKDHS